MREKRKKFSSFVHLRPPRFHSLTPAVPIGSPWELPDVQPLSSYGTARFRKPVTFRLVAELCKIGPCEDPVRTFAGECFPRGEGATPSNHCASPTSLLEEPISLAAYCPLCAQPCAGRPASTNRFLDFWPWEVDFASHTERWVCSRCPFAHMARPLALGPALPGALLDTRATSRLEGLPKRCREVTMQVVSGQSDARSDMASQQKKVGDCASMWRMHPGSMSSMSSMSERHIASGHTPCRRDRETCVGHINGIIAQSQPIAI